MFSVINKQGKSKSFKKFWKAVEEARSVHLSYEPVKVMGEKRRVMRRLKAGIYYKRKLVAQVDEKDYYLRSDVPEWLIDEINATSTPPRSRTYMKEISRGRRG